MNKVHVRDLDVRGKRVLVRVDFNVPYEDGEISDDRRIRESLETIRWLADHGARLILMSHHGDPKGKREPAESLAPCAERLGQLLRKEVKFAPDCIGPEVESRLQGLGDGDILLLENLRFHAGETKNDPAFAAALARLAEVYVNDAFGTSHRAHASMVGVPERVPVRGIGFLVEKEIAYLGNAVSSPRRPFVAIIGGAKVSSKIKVIESLLEKVDHLLIGGGMSYTFFKAQGLEVGKSILEADKVGLAKSLLDGAAARGKDRLILPVDVVAADRCADDADTSVVAVNAIPADRECLDIGPRTIELFRRKILAAKTVVWNGPMGVFEVPRFAAGTNAIAAALAEAKDAGATTIVGGGDSAAAIEKAGLASRVSHVSTGGGASLEFLEGRAFPALQTIPERAR